MPAGYWGVDDCMPDELQAVRAVEKTVAFVEEHPGLVARLGEVATAAWSKTGQALGFVSKEEGAAAEAAAARKVLETATHSGAAGESILARTEGMLGAGAETIKGATTAETPSFIGSFGRRISNALTSTPAKLGYAGVGTLALAGCDKGNKDSEKPVPLSKLGLDLPGATKPGPPSETSVPVVSGKDGTPTLVGNPNRPIDQQYPGGIGPDVNQVRDLINDIPGPQGFAAKQAFALFINNYNSRVNESQIPKQLPLVDLPQANDASSQFVTGYLDHWQLKHDVDLYSPISDGPFAGRNMRPATDVAPGGGKRPPMFYALGLDAANRPVDMLEYYNPGTGTKYREQYQFRYENMPDGGKRVTVYNWMDSTETTDIGIQKVIGNKQNTLEGISQYYFSANGYCSKAVHYDGQMLLQPKDQWQPLVDIKFQNGQAIVSDRDGLSGQMLPYKAVDDFTLRQKAQYFSMYNMLGPKLQDIPNGK